MWSWSSFSALVDSTPSPDAAHLCGQRVQVDLLEETHFAVGASIDIRRVRCRDVNEDWMTLRVRSANHFSAGVECWISRPKLRLRCGMAATSEVAWKECLPWLMRQSELCTNPKPRGNLARSHATPSADPSALLAALAKGEIKPQAVPMCRRRIRSAVPTEHGALVEQSDLEVGGLLWRCMSLESTNPSTLRHALGSVREILAPISCTAPPLVVSTPQFIATVLRTDAVASQEHGHEATSRAPTSRAAAVAADEAPALPRSAASTAPPPRSGAAGERMTAAPVSLSGCLLDAWYQSTDVFSQRLFRAAQVSRGTHAWGARRCHLALLLGGVRCQAVPVHPPVLGCRTLPPLTPALCNAVCLLLANLTPVCVCVARACACASGAPSVVAASCSCTCCSGRSTAHRASRSRANQLQLRASRSWIHRN